MTLKDDLDDVKIGISGLEKIRDSLDCHMCRDHVELAIGLLRDIVDITTFTTLYDDPTAVNKFREMIQKENTVRLLAIGSRLVGIWRKVRLRVHRDKP